MLELQKASVLKRISAGIFDFILLITLAVGLMLAASSILEYGSYLETFAERQNFYADKYGIDPDIATEDYNKLTDEEKAVYEKATEELSADKEANKAFSMMFNLSLIIVTFPLLISYLILEFAVPLLFKNGQTLGKKIFGIAVMRRDGIRLSGTFLFARTVLGKFTVGTMIPVLLFIMMFFGVMGIEAIVIIVGILFMQIMMFVLTKTRELVHDKLAQTVTVDMASQMIFDTPEELIAFKNRLQSENADKAAY